MDILEEVVQEVNSSDVLIQDLIVRLEYVTQCLVSIDTTLKYFLILFLICIGVILAKYIIWDVVIKHI